MKTIDPIAYPGWDELLFSDRSGCFFHSSMWAKTLFDSYKYASRYFLKMKDKKIETLIPFMEVDSFLTGKRGVALPFSDYCPPIIHKDDDLYSHMAHLIEYGKRSGWKYIELRGGQIPSAIRPYKYYYIYTLKLCENEQELLKGLKSSNRRNIKKAQKSSVEIRMSCDFEAIEIFYKLHCITRKRHGVPPQSFSFFENIYNNIISKNHGMVVMAYYNDKPISANVYFHSGKKAIYKYGASDLRYQHLRVNNLSMWHAIKWYGQHGYEYFCFGRTSPDNKGLLQFKASWGAKRTTLNYYRYHLRENKFITENAKDTKLINKAFEKMPISLLKIFGKVLYPHVG